VAGVLRDTLGAGDLPGRYGGDEFVALLPASRLDEGLAVVKRLRATLSSTVVRIPGGDTVLRLSCSIGGACLPEDGTDAQTLFAVAEVDRALGLIPQHDTGSGDTRR
jgi:diguanylate cyclase (GGDEF)-like protein